MILLSVVVQFFVCQIGQNKLLALPAAAKPGPSFILENVAVMDFPIQVDQALPRVCSLDDLVLGEGNCSSFPWDASANHCSDGVFLCNGASWGAGRRFKDIAPELNSSDDSGRLAPVPVNYFLILYICITEEYIGSLNIGEVFGGLRGGFGGVFSGCGKV